ncbi:MAG: hypothetical protein KC613_27960, partial [Myxococcales bacterium]|nr:hypothetical protein [Myxococcales bacterium]
MGALAIWACEGTVPPTSPGVPALDATLPTDQTPPPDAAWDAPPPDPEPDGAAPDAGVPDAAPDATPADAGPPVDPLGFTAAERALVAGLMGPVALAPDPTNRVADDPQAAALGQALFFSDALGPGDANCPFCHSPEPAFSGPLSYDQHGGLRFRNVPSLINAAAQPWLFWDGRADTSWGQVVTPFEDPEEMASDRVFIARAVAADPALRGPYEALFGPLPAALEGTALPDRATPFPTAQPELQAAWAALSAADQQALSEVLANVGKAIAAFQRTLVHTEGPFDRFARALMAGDPAAGALLSPQAVEGLRLFIGPAGCLACHHGPTLSDGAFHNLGQAPFARDAHPDGRAGAIPRLLASEFNAAGPYSDAPDGDHAARLADLLLEDPGTPGRFKTPTLRNVALTGPWLHDGRFHTLADVIRFKT